MDNVLVGCTTANGFSGSNEQIETTCKDGTNPPPRTYESGAQDASITADMIVRFDDDNQYSKVAAAWGAATEHTWKLATPNSDDPYWQFDGKVSQFNETGNLNSPLTVSITVTPTGPVYLRNT